MADNKDAPELKEIPIDVLIVDDDEAHAQAVADSLKKVGCDCTIATSGERGIQHPVSVHPKQKDVNFAN